jgi:hypothetical protein
VPGHVGPALTQQLYRTTLETLHKHSDTRLKITAHHPRTYKTSRGLILPRELYYALTNIKDLEKKIGVRTKRSKPKHILGIEHRNIPIQPDLCGNAVIFREKDKTTLYGYRYCPDKALNTVWGLLFPDRGGYETPHRHINPLSGHYPDTQGKKIN